MEQISTDLQKTKRALVTYGKKLTAGDGRVKQKFYLDMLYGLLASGSTVLADIARSLKEKSKVENTVDRLARQLKEPLSAGSKEAYRQHVLSLLPKNPMIFVDDTDIIKPSGRHFEAMARVMDGSRKENGQPVFGHGYQCTEMVGLTDKRKQPISLYSHMHSSVEPGYRSVNDITDRALQRLFLSLPDPATFVFDRGYDRTGLFSLFSSREQNPRGHQFIVRMKGNRQFQVPGKQWMTAPQLADRYKGRWRFTQLWWNRDKSRLEEKTVYMTSLPVSIRESDSPFWLVLVYRQDMPPMYLLTNTAITEKKDAVHAVTAYAMRWRIEEYFRFKKQQLGMENFRVRSLTAIRHLHHLLTLAVGWLAFVAEQTTVSGHYAGAMLSYARAIRQKVMFLYYRLQAGLQQILALARTGIRGYLRPRARPDPQLSFSQWVRFNA